MKAVKALLLTISFVSTGHTQNKPSPEAFEVVSIKPSGPGGSGSGRGGPGGGTGGCRGGVPQINPGRIVLNNNSLYTLIAWAYGLDCDNATASGLISGGPEWIKSDQWVIQATIPETAGLQLREGQPIYHPGIGRSPISDTKLQTMVQNLLKEHFKLALHREAKEAPVYELTVAKSGPKLQHPEDVPCMPRSPNAKPPVKPVAEPCFLSMTESIADFSKRLSLILDRPIVDKTGIVGTYELRLPNVSVAPTTDTTSGTSIFTAVEEQLGLKLESRKGSVQVIVIDSAEKPPEK
jgi:uncharacterized protein (TIGR03435 family)